MYLVQPFIRVLKTITTAISNSIELEIYKNPVSQHILVPDYFVYVNSPDECTQHNPLKGEGLLLLLFTYIFM